MVPRNVCEEETIRKLPLIAILIIALLAGCQPVAVTAPPPDPALPTAAPVQPSDPVPPKVLLKPKSALGPDEQKQTYEQVIARGKPSNGEPVIIQITEKEFYKLQGLTASIHDIDGQPYEVIFRGDEVVGLTSLGAHGTLPVLSPDHRSISLTGNGQTMLRIYDIATGELIGVPIFEEFRPLKAYDHWGITPLWARDSNHLYFVGTSSGKSRLFRVDRDGSNLRQPYPNTMVYKLWGMINRSDLIAMAGEPGKVAFLREDGSSATTIAEITAEIGSNSPSGNLVIAAPRENAFIDVLDIPQGATTRVQLGAYKYGSSPVGWSPSEERLATIINPVIEGEPAVAVVEWRQRSAIRVPVPKGFHPSWQPVTWLDEEMFVIWLKEANASSDLGPNTIPFLVRLP